MSLGPSLKSNATSQTFVTRQMNWTRTWLRSFNCHPRITGMNALPDKHVTYWKSSETGKKAFSAQMKARELD